MKVRATCNHEILTEVAKELGLSFFDVREIVNSQSLFTKQIIESNSFDGVRWPYFGVFKAKPKEVQIINHLKGLTDEQKKEFKQRLRNSYYIEYEKSKRQKREKLEGHQQDNVHLQDTRDRHNPS